MVKVLKSNSKLKFIFKLQLVVCHMDNFCPMKTAKCEIFIIENPNNYLNNWLILTYHHLVGLFYKHWYRLLSQIKKCIFSVFVDLNNKFQNMSIVCHIHNCFPIKTAEICNGVRCVIICRYMYIRKLIGLMWNIRANMNKWHNALIQ